MTEQYNITYSVKVDSVMDQRIKRYQEGIRYHKNGMMLRSLIKLGLDSYDLIIGKHQLSGLPLEVESIVDRLSGEQKEQLLELLVQKLGIREVGRLRMLAERIEQK